MVSFAPPSRLKPGESPYFYPEYASREEIKLLDLLEKNINAEFKAIEDYTSFRDALNIIDIDSNIKAIINEILSDEVDHYNKLLNIKRRIWG